MHRLFFCCTDCHHHRECSSRSCRVFPSTITWWRPDYPGFGHSDWPDPKTFHYTFDHYAEIMNRFTESLGLSRYTLYMQDYGDILDAGHFALDTAADEIAALVRGFVAD